MDLNTADKTIARLIQHEGACDHTSDALHAALTRQHDRVLRVRQNLQKRLDQNPGDEIAVSGYERATAMLARLSVAIGNLGELRIQGDGDVR